MVNLESVLAFPLRRSWSGCAESDGLAVLHYILSVDVEVYGSLSDSALQLAEQPRPYRGCES